MTAGVLLLTVAGLLRRRRPGRGGQRGARGERSSRSAPSAARPAKLRVTPLHLVALAAGVAVLLLTGWPVAAIAAAAAVVFVPQVLGGGKAAKRMIAKSEALADWTRRLADLISSGAAGSTRDALRRSLNSVPDPIARRGHPPGAPHGPAGHRAGAAAVRARGRRPGRGEDRRRADPAGTQRRAGPGRRAHRRWPLDLDDRSRMVREVEAERAKPRANMRTIVIVTGVLIVGMMLFARTFLSSYSTASRAGRCCSVVAAVFAIALRWMRRLSDPPTPPRVLVDPEPGPVRVVTGLQTGHPRRDADRGSGWCSACARCGPRRRRCRRAGAAVGRADRGHAVAADAVDRGTGGTGCRRGWPACWTGTSGVSDADLKIIGWTAVAAGGPQADAGARRACSPRRCSAWCCCCSALGAFAVFPVARRARRSPRWAGCCPSQEAREAAAKARLEFRTNLEFFLTLVAGERRARGSVEQALEEAVEISGSMPFVQMRRAIRRAALSGRKPWSDLRALGEELEVAELRNLADIAEVAADGAAVYNTLLATARTLRHAELSDARTEANEVSERMSRPLAAARVRADLVRPRPVHAAHVRDRASRPDHTTNEGRNHLMSHNTVTAARAAAPVRDADPGAGHARGVAARRARHRRPRLGLLGEGLMIILAITIGGAVTGGRGGLRGHQDGPVQVGGSADAMPGTRRTERARRARAVRARAAVRRGMASRRGDE